MGEKSFWARNFDGAIERTYETGLIEDSLLCVKEKPRTFGIMGERDVNELLSIVTPIIHDSMGLDVLARRLRELPHKKFTVVASLFEELHRIRMAGGDTRKFLDGVKDGSIRYESDD